MRRQAVVGETLGIGQDPDLGRQNAQAGQGAGLVAFAAGEFLEDSKLRLGRHIDDVVQIGAADVEIDVPAAAETPAEQRGLADEASGARFAVDGPAHDRDQLADAGRVDRRRRRQGKAAPDDEPEPRHLRRAVFRRGLTFRRAEQRPHLGFGLLGHGNDGVQIVAGGRDHPGEQQIAVALGQIFELRQERPGRDAGNAADQRHHGDGANPAGDDKAGVAEDEDPEPMGEMIDARQLQHGLAGADAALQDSVGQ